MKRRQGRQLVLDVLKGLVAGAAGIWAMGKVTTPLYEHEDKDARRREDEARGGKSAMQVAAEKVVNTLHWDMNENGINRLATGLHWVAGMGGAVGYSILRRRIPSTARLGGLSFATSYWAVVDELMNPVLGFTPGPGAFPWQTHARGLAGHLTYGVVTNAALAAMDRLLPPAR